MFKKSFIIVTALVMTLAHASAFSANDPKVKISTSMGDIVIQLNQEKAPETVKNFLNYVNSGFYNGTVFHRVISNFMVQGGGFTVDMKQKDTAAPIRNEANNGLQNARGTIAMARTSDPHSATAQFFINVVDNHFLNYRAQTTRGWGYAVFGKVTQGMDVVDKIRRVKTGAQRPFGRDVPQTPVVINQATVITEE